MNPEREQQPIEGVDAGVHVYVVVDADKTAGSVSNPVCVKRLRAQCVWKVNTAHPLWQRELPPPHVSNGYVGCGALLARGPIAQRLHVHSSGHIMEFYVAYDELIRPGKIRIQLRLYHQNISSISFCLSPEISLLLIS